MNPDQKALIAAIREDPDDDAPRLVYADWLEERATESSPCTNPFCKNGWVDCYTITSYKCGKCDGGTVRGNGFAERAEFIRVQCELAKPPACEWMTRGMHCERWNQDARPYRVTVQCKTCRKIDTLRKRERELLWRSDMPAGVEAMPKPDWVPASDKVSHAWTQWEFRRGFIDAITTDWASCRDHLDSILEEHPVRRVSLTDRPNELPYKKEGDIGIIFVVSKDGRTCFSETRFDWRRSTIRLGHTLEEMPFSERFKGAFRGRWPGVEVELPTYRNEGSMGQLNIPVPMQTHGVIT